MKVLLQKNKLLGVVFLISLLISQTQADLPVHCLTKDIQGVWKLKMTATQNGQQSCGHESPDKNTDHIYSDFKSNFQQNSELAVNLIMPDVVQDMNGKRIGKWTMVYDEGFEVKLDNLNFFSFSKYSIDYGRTPKDTDDEQTSGYESDCTQTFLGWFHDNNNHWGCFYGEKINGSLDQHVSQESLFAGTEGMKIVQRDDLVQQGRDQRVEVDNGPIVDDASAQIDKEINDSLYGLSNQVNNNQYSFAEQDQKESIFTANNKKDDSNEYDFYERFKQQLPLYDLPHTDYLQFNTTLQDQDQGFFELDYSFIELVNSQKSNSPWKAKAHKHFAKLSQKEMKGYIGMTEGKQQKFASFLQTNTANKNPVFRLRQKMKNGRLVDDENQETKKNLRTDKSQIFQEARFKQKNQKYSGEVCGKSENGIPRCFDWRNKDGVSYDTPIKRQGECGSCYAVATISALESRIRIKSNNRYKPFLSASGSMGCSRYNQGCNGGYPYLVAKHFKEFGVYNEDCQPYRDHDQQCKASCFTQSKVWRISDYGYVGRGYYGSTNEQAMMEEIYKNGPVVVAFNAAPDLYYYDSGVFITNPSNPLIQSNDHPEVRAWQFTNHAVVCVGWGETIHNGELLQYWILKNSWGEDWGENGYFNMLRGVNLGAVENQAVFMTPIIE